MNERLLARLLNGAGFSTIGFLPFFADGWDASGPGLRVVFVVGLAAAVAGVDLNVKQRREDKRARSAESAG